MARRRWFFISLARKVSLLFGTAVLLVIAVTLWSPWLQMTALNRQAMLMQAKQVAAAAYQAVDLRAPNWSGTQHELRQRWPALVHELGLPPKPPRLIPTGAYPPRGFHHEALQRLGDNPHKR